MKKTFMILTALCAASFASAADKVGVFLLGAQYEHDTSAANSVRFGVGLPIAAAVSSGGLLVVSGDVSVLHHTERAGASVQPYVGGGLGLVGLFGRSDTYSTSVFGLYPNVLGGANFRLSEQFSLFAEGSVGPNILFSSARAGTTSAAAASVAFGFGVRLGVNYKLR